MDEMIFAMSGTFSEDINQMRGAITIDGVTTCHTIMKKKVHLMHEQHFLS